MTQQDIIDSGTTGRYEKSTYLNGMARYPCYLIECRIGWISTSSWLKPDSLPNVLAFIEKHKKDIK